VAVGGAGLAKVVVVAAVGLLAAGGLAGCSSSSSSGPLPSVSVPSGAGLAAPIIVTPGETTATAPVGATVVFNETDPAKTKVVSDAPAVLEVTQGRDDGSAQFNPGGVALSPGVAHVTITAADGSVSTVAVTVTG
jgi:hypothetical protein